MPPKSDPLTRRERQIMDIIFARGEATAADVNAALPDQPSYSTVRTLLRQGQPATVKSVDGTTPLHWAAYHENLAMVELLVQAGGVERLDRRRRDRDGFDPRAASVTDHPSDDDGHRMRSS